MYTCMYKYIYIYQCECGSFKLPIIPHLSSPGIIIQLSETQGTTILPETTPERRAKRRQQMLGFNKPDCVISMIYD